jgi:hypothetical protein
VERCIGKFRKGSESLFWGIFPQNPLGGITAPFSGPNPPQSPLRGFEGIQGDSRGFQSPLRGFQSPQRNENPLESPGIPMRNLTGGGKKKFKMILKFYNDFKIILKSL